MPNVQYLFTAALMHDIGIVLLLTNARDDEQACLETAAASGQPLSLVEDERLGCNHAELGARACAAWKLPERIAELIAAHHRTPALDALDHRVLALADALAVVTGMPELDGRTPPTLDDELLRPIGLTSEDLESLLAKQDDVSAETASFA